MVKSTKHYRICGYVRVSTEEQAESPEGSIKNQEERIRQAVRHKLETGASVELIDVYVDAGLSAKDMKRPALQKMLNSIKKKEINLVIVTELSRLSRNTKDFCEMWEFFVEHGCEFQSMREQFDTTTAAGVLMLKSLANFAEFERNQTAERISASFKVRAERGLWNGGPVPLGYRPTSDKSGRLVIHEEEAKIIRMAFQAFLENESLSTTSKWLNDNNYKLSKKMVNGGSHRVGHFLIDTLHHILTNKSYIGVRVFNTKEGKKESKALWDAIVDEETFLRVQAKLAKNGIVKKKPHSGKRYPYTLTGIIFCGVCGDRLCGKSAHGKRKKYPFYEHARVNKVQGTLTKQLYACQPHRFPGEVVEQKAWSAVEELMSSPAVAKVIMEQAQREHSKLDFNHEEDRLRNKVYANQGQLNALTERLSEIPTDVDATPIYNQMKKIGITKKELEEKILMVRRQNHEHELPAELADYLEFLKMLKASGMVFGPVERQKIISQLVEKIELLPNGMKIHFFVGTSRIKKGPAKAGPSYVVSRCSTNLTFGGE